MAPDDPPGRRRTRDPDGTKLRLLQAAGHRFLLQGFDRTTTREIAEDAGVNISLISRYFGGKRGLYQAVVANMADLFEDDQENEPHPDGVLAGFVESLDPALWPAYGAHPLKLLLQDTGDPDDRALRGTILRETVRRYIVRGEPRDTCHELRADLVFALFSGVVLLRDAGTLEPLAGASPDEIGRELEGLVERLLGGEGPG